MIHEKSMTFIQKLKKVANIIVGSTILWPVWQIFSHFTRWYTCNMYKFKCIDIHFIHMNLYMNIKTNKNVCKAVWICQLRIKNRKLNQLDIDFLILISEVSHREVTFLQATMLIKSLQCIEMACQSHDCHKCHFHTFEWFLSIRTLVKMSFTSVTSLNNFESRSLKIWTVY